MKSEDIHGCRSEAVTMESQGTGQVERVDDVSIRVLDVNEPPTDARFSVRRTPKPDN